MDPRMKRRSMLGQPYGASSTSLNRNTPSSPSQPSYETQQPTARIKLVCVGDGGIGKTSLFTRYVRGEFPETYVPTVFDNHIKNVKFKQHLVELALWDTAGQEEYDRLRALSYPETDAILLCYSIDEPMSLENAYERWKPEVALYCPGVPVVLVGLKSDFSDRPDALDWRSGEELARKIGAVSFITCSAKTGHHIDEVFVAALAAVLDPPLPGELQTTVSREQSTKQAPAQKAPATAVKPDAPAGKRKRRHRCLIL